MLGLAFRNLPTAHQGHPHPELPRENRTPPTSSSTTCPCVRFKHWFRQTNITRGTCHPTLRSPRTSRSAPCVTSKTITLHQLWSEPVRMAVLTRRRLPWTEHLTASWRCVTPSRRSSHHTRMLSPRATLRQWLITSTTTPSVTMWVIKCSQSIALTPTKWTSWKSTRKACWRFRTCAVRESATMVVLIRLQKIKGVTSAR